MRLALPLFLFLSACATVPQDTIGETLVYAEVTATSANETATALLNSGVISVDAAVKVRQASNTVFLAVQKAREVLTAKDVAAAQMQLNAIKAELAQLKLFLTTHKK